MADNTDNGPESESPVQVIPAGHHPEQGPDSIWHGLEHAGITCGMLLGGGLAYWICHIYQIPLQKRWIWVLLAGIYCTIPGTGPVPLATLAGAYVRYRRPARKTQEETCVEDTR